MRFSLTCLQAHRGFRGSRQFCLTVLKDSFAEINFGRFQLAVWASFFDALYMKGSYSIKCESFRATRIRNTHPLRSIGSFEWKIFSAKNRFWTKIGRNIDFRCARGYWLIPINNWVEVSSPFWWFCCKSQKFECWLSFLCASDSKLMNKL